MGQARSLANVDDESSEYSEYSEERVVNVSPYDARIEIASAPGSPARKIRLKPGKSMPLPAGYCKSFLSPNRVEIPAWIETHTEREAWPGQRTYDSTKEAFVWKIHPGPRLPQVVEESRAEEFAARWAAAMKERSDAANAPLRMTLHTQEGVPVEVEAKVEPAPRRRVPAEDEDEPFTIEEPPPDVGDPIGEPQLPVITAPPADTAPEPTSRRGRAAR